MSESADPPPQMPAACPVCGAALPSASGGLCARCLMADAARPTQVPGTGQGVEAPSLADVTAAFSQFEIIELIGAGGMGTVWRARQPKLNRHVALKLLPASLAERDPAFAERFEREGQLLARLHHPNIVAVHDSGRAGNFFFLAMEFVDGVNLRQAMRASRFTAQQALAIVPKICDALQYAHEEGVLHRDIKPENILLDAKGRVKLVDFGIAKVVGDGSQESDQIYGTPSRGLTQAGSTLGTPSYMAPEQREMPTAVDHRADIYSLGVVFYELLTGELPIGKFAPPSARSGADPRLDGIVQQALEKDRENRQRSVGEMRTQVETISGGPADAATHSSESGGDVSVPRMSRMAIGGACWMILFFAVVPAFIAHEAETHEFWHSGPFASALTCFVSFVFLMPAFIGPFGATLLGYIAVSQIRRSAGKFYGMGLAVFDGLFFPLLALDALIVLAWGNAQRFYIAHFADVSIPLDRFILSDGCKEIFFLLALATAAATDFLVIRKAWRGVSEALSVAPGALAEPSRINIATLAKVSGISIILLAITAALIHFRSPDHRAGDAADGEIRYYVFETDADLVERLVPGETRRPGQMRDADLEIPSMPAGVGSPINAVSQTAEISADTFGKLMADGWVKEPGLLAERHSEFHPWPGVADTWAYSRTERFAGVGGASGRLGLRTRKGALQLRAEYHVTHDLDCAYQNATLAWEGAAPPSRGARAFFIPFSRREGTARFLVIAFEVLTGEDARADRAAHSNSIHPKGMHTSVSDRSVVVHHDEQKVKFAYFFDGAIWTGPGKVRGEESPSWMDDGRITLWGDHGPDEPGRVFAYHREVVRPDFLLINGKEYALRNGCVFVLHADGSVDHLALTPSLETANNPDDLAELIANTATSPAARRVAMEQRLWREIQRRLNASHIAFWSLTVAVSPDLGSASVSVIHAQERRHVNGKDAWVDLNDATLAVRHTGDGRWKIEGRGGLAATRIDIDMADLMGPAAGERGISDLTIQQKAKNQ